MPNINLCPLHRREKVLDVLVNQEAGEKKQKLKDPITELSGMPSQTKTGLELASLE